MRLIRTALSTLLPFQVYSLSCQPDTEEPTCLTCDDLDQNLSGLDLVDWSQYQPVTKLKLKLNDAEPGVNSSYLPILESVLESLSATLTDLTLVRFNNAISNQVLLKAPNLDTLHISKTDVEALPLRLFKDTRIENFKIADSEMTRIDNQVFGSSSLKKLILEKNRLGALEEDSFVHCKTLEHLDLSDNNIAEVHLEVLKPLVELKKLDMDNNGLTFIPEDFLKRNKELRHLSLAGNSLDSLPCNLLKNHFSLASLNITSNNFKTIPCHLLSRQGEQLTTFDASNNQIHDRYNKDLSHKRGVSFKLNKKGLKANGKVTATKEEDGEISLEGNDNQIQGTLGFVCDQCDRLPPRKKLKKKLRLEGQEPQAEPEGEPNLL